MTDSTNLRVSNLAAELLAAHRGGVLTDGLEAPADEAQAYAVQRAVAARLGRIVGWKVGRKGPDAPPACAPLLDARLFASGDEVPATGPRQPQLEAELVLTIGRDLPPAGLPYDRESVCAAIDAVRPGFELVESRLAAWPNAPPLLQLADLQSHGCMVLGDPAPNMPDEPWDRARLRLEVDGAVIVDGVVENPAGDLLDLTAWLANHLATSVGGLRAGDLVTTGSFTGVTPLRPGGKARADFAGVGTVACGVRGVG